ncbi:MAG: MerR family transcriptional regulator, partial [Blastocatellia bacterium]|nr:MerR family transcriptional regulator [Blastocatellia bacterium]
QKNRAGQRTYRRKDVEMALRIRELLYEEGFTIAGAKRKLLGEGRGGASSRLQIVPPGGLPNEVQESAPSPEPVPEPPQISRLSRDTIKRLKLLAEDLLTTLKTDVKK